VTFPTNVKIIVIKRFATSNYYYNKVMIKSKAYFYFPLKSFLTLTLHKSNEKDHEFLSNDNALLFKISDK